MPSAPDFEAVVSRFYEALYRFALSLTRSDAEACDLTQHAFYVWATKGSQIRDAAKVKAWLFTTLHRQFLKHRRREERFPHYELGEVDRELPKIELDTIERMDSAAVMACLGEVEEIFRAPLSLYYLEECSYKEISDILRIPLGTVQSRILRGKERIRWLLAKRDTRIPPVAKREQRG